MDLTIKVWKDNTKLGVVVTKPNENTLTMMPVRSLIYVQKKYGLKSGDILCKVRNKPHFILASHHETEEMDVLLGLRVNTMAEVKKQYSGTHPTTGMPTGQFNMMLITIPAVLQVGVIQDEKSLQTDNSVYYVAERLSKDDVIEGRNIHSIQEIAGLFRVEVR